MSTGFISIIQRDLLQAFRNRSDIATTVFFFVMVASLFPLAVSPDPAILRQLGPGVLWVAALLACMLSLSRLFASDYADGTLEQLVISPHSLSLLTLGKIVAHWLVSGLPVVLLSPLLALQYGMHSQSLWILALSLLLGTPALSLIGAIGAALTLGVRGSGLLIALLVLPLYIPILIFGAGAVTASQTGISAEANLSLLAASTLLALLLAPFASATALRIAVE
ncbi:MULTISPECIES: heme exporter protein CcmB [Methylotenera]|uniref:heme exporter protein CcmB n=1 Tax=Methylotenera TaxID=359407 RepID=UPI0003789072|nr:MULTISPECIES: heme exporter protein CcmB [Methylotenera]